MDPFSLTALGTVALTEGVKFLYGQATELLQGRRARCNEGEGPEGLPPSVQSDVLNGVMRPIEVNETVLESNSTRLRELRRALADHADGLAPIDLNDSVLLRRVDALRGVLELIYGQRITFDGEEGRASTGTPLSTGALAAIEEYAATVTASGIGAVAIGRDNTGVITTGTASPQELPPHRNTN